MTSRNRKERNMAQHLLKVRNIKKYFPIRSGLLRRTVGHVKAVDDVSFELAAGETLGIVGESGCGKSTLGRMIMRVTDPTDGDILFEDVNLTQMSRTQLRSIRDRFQMVFQDPYSSLNPRMNVGQILSEPLVIKGIRKKEALEKAAGLLERVGLRARDLERYPHQFSGGQRQRIGIARAISLNPKLIVADEAVSALDVSIQSQILNLMMDLKHELNLAYIFISHNLAVVRHISARVGVMYLGSMVELGDKSDVYGSPLHPYTQALLASAPVARREANRQRIVLEGELPNPANPPAGCPFHPRCPQAMDICARQKPALKEAAPRHSVSCHLY
ncbi:ABC transporter ATP-binding protein [Paenibacillus humicola]|uniref:ABC transporter ATP-binding protein n=1 Tax=Paenibacillus humicola TaxID=3110540 RepID=UPI003B834BFD